MRAKRIYIMLATQQNIIERSLRLAIEFNTEGQRLRDDKTDVNPYTAALLWNLAEVNTGHNRARNN